MSIFLGLPMLFLRFWFLEAPVGLFWFFASLNNAFMQLFSLPLLLRTYFRPWKNEYREGLVVFSIGMGMFVKTFAILADLILLLLLVCLEIIAFIVFITWPIMTVYLLLIYR